MKKVIISFLLVFLFFSCDPIEDSPSGADLTDQISAFSKINIDLPTSMSRSISRVILTETNLDNANINELEFIYESVDLMEINIYNAIIDYSQSSTITEDDDIDLLGLDGISFTLADDNSIVINFSDSLTNLTIKILEDSSGELDIESTIYLNNNGSIIKRYIMYNTANKYIDSYINRNLLGVDYNYITRIFNENGTLNYFREAEILGVIDTFVYSSNDNTGLGFNLFSDGGSNTLEGILVVDDSIVETRTYTEQITGSNPKLLGYEYNATTDNFYSLKKALPLLNSHTLQLISGVYYVYDSGNSLILTLTTTTEQYTNITGWQYDEQNGGTAITQDVNYVLLETEPNGVYFDYSYDGTYDTTFTTMKAMVDVEYPLFKALEVDMDIINSITY
ncbi:MAG: hypothetical protein OCD02_14845 [Spirochaetaceae bacterium]